MTVTRQVGTPRSYTVSRNVDHHARQLAISRALAFTDHARDQGTYWHWARSSSQRWIGPEL